jgi:hypothetical protein
MLTKWGTHLCNAGTFPSTFFSLLFSLWRTSFSGFDSKKLQNEHFYLLPASHCLQQVGPRFGIGLIFVLIVAAGDLLVLEGLRGFSAAHGKPHVDGLGKRRHMLARE